jgi:hypothetical protein
VFHAKNVTHKIGILALYLFEKEGCPLLVGEPRQTFFYQPLSFPELRKAVRVTGRRAPPPVGGESAIHELFGVFFRYHAIAGAAVLSNFIDQDTANERSDLRPRFESPKVGEENFPRLVDQVARITASYAIGVAYASKIWGYLAEKFLEKSAVATLEKEHSALIYESATRLFHRKFGHGLAKTLPDKLPTQLHLLERSFKNTRP